jgi:hypothetical protein
MHETPITFLDAVREGLAAAGRCNPADMAPPAAVLWADPDEQWRPVAEALRPLLPELLTLGEFDPVRRIGPAIWLRCVIERALPEPALPAGAVPLLYLPGVSRQALRAVEECPDALKPLVELQYRGTVWSQKNGKDWTVEAFLVSEDGGLGLDVARDRQTREALAGALSQLVATHLAQLRGRRLEAEDFDKLMLGDPDRQMLLWLNDAAATRYAWSGAKWQAFRSRCKAAYGVDPEGDGELAAAEKLGRCEDEAWRGVWARFAEAPGLYLGVPPLLEKAKPQGALIFQPQTWPDENRKLEADLRQALGALAKAAPAQARKKLLTLEVTHGPRRQWVWACLGQASLAMALERLAQVARQTAKAIGGDTPEDMGKLYREGAYVPDQAAWQALAAVRSPEDTAAVATALRAVYLPWLEDAALRLQELAGQHPLPAQPPVQAEEGTVILFVDGLRYDLGQCLGEMLTAQGIEVHSGWRWAALPTVTAAAKPAVSPLAGELQGLAPGESYAPELGGEPLTAARFAKRLGELGYQILEAADTGDPAAAGARAWTEAGRFDELGHALEARLATQIAEQLEQVAHRVRELLDAGWRQVRVVTDHGWLLLPGGLPTAKLAKYLAESRWRRCAALKDTSHGNHPAASWHWNPVCRFAYAPGVACYVAGSEYAHGGVSLQECMVPELAFLSAAGGAVAAAKIHSVQWHGLRCRVVTDPVGAGLQADLRTKPNDPASSITDPKPVDAEGKVGLLVKDEDLKGSVASLVLLDAAGKLVCKETTTVGGEE